MQLDPFSFQPPLSHELSIFKCTTKRLTQQFTGNSHTAPAAGQRILATHNMEGWGCGSMLAGYRPQRAQSEAGGSWRYRTSIMRTKGE